MKKRVLLTITILLVVLLTGCGGRKQIVCVKRNKDVIDEDFSPVEYYTKAIYYFDDNDENTKYYQYVEQILPDDLYSYLEENDMLEDFRAERDEIVENAWDKPAFKYSIKSNINKNIHSHTVEVVPSEEPNFGQTREEIFEYYKGRPDWSCEEE